jgi:plastocyanin
MNISMKVSRRIATRACTLSGIRTFIAAVCLLVGGVASSADLVAPAVVEIRDFMFDPGVLTVTAGTTVTWTNRDDDAHSVVSSTGLFHSSALDTGEHFQFTFDHPGTYQVRCSLHPRMAGTVVVK